MPRRADPLAKIFGLGDRRFWLSGVDGQQNNAGFRVAGDHGGECVQNPLLVALLHQRAQGAAIRGANVVVFWRSSTFFVVAVYSAGKLPHVGHAALVQHVAAARQRLGVTHDFQHAQRHDSARVAVFVRLNVRADQPPEQPCDHPSHKVRQHRHADHHHRTFQREGKTRLEVAKRALDEFWT